MKLLLDYETRSREDLIKSGQHIYAKGGSTEIMCVGWKVIGEKDSHVITYPGVYTDDSSQTKEFYYALKHSEHVIAHNAAFEQAIYKYVHLLTTPMGQKMRELAPKDFICTLSLCSILALPRSLENAGNALSLGIKKNVEARKLLLQMCKPRKPIQNIKAWIEWVESDQALKDLYAYCETDIKAEEQLWFELSKYKPFTKKERALWVLDQEINQRGFTVDIELVKKIMAMIKKEETELTSKLREKTFGWVKTSKQVKNLKDFLLDQGFELPNLQKKTVDETIAKIEKENLEKNKDVLEVLKIRQSLGKSSTSKYEAFIKRSDTDKRVRDNLLFHGASTGRWAGSGVQPQNFPRGTVKMNAEVYEDLKTLDLDMIRMLYSRPMDLFSSALRGVIIASPGKELFCADFSSIEARVLLWVAGDVSGMDEYEGGVDSYKSMASFIFGVPYDQVTDDQRFLGKTVILACGYQMGLKKFAATVHEVRPDMPMSLIQKAHSAFKQKYPRVPQVWTNYELAAIKAVSLKGTRVKINKVTWYYQGDFLFAELPSGRRLAYYKPEIRNEETPWGDIKPKLYHWGVDSKTKKWVLAATYGGKLTENIVQAISRDCMAESMTRCEDAGYECLVTVHDENLAERKIGEGNLKDFESLMSMRPEWGQDIPLKVGAWTGLRYKK